MIGPHGNPKTETSLTGATLTFGPWRARPLLDSDADFALRFLTEEGVAAARTPPAPDGVDDAVSWVTDALTDPSCIPWVLESRNDGVSVGFIALQEFDRLTGVAEVGFLVVPSARRMGLATAALETVTAWAFDNLDLHRLYLVHDTGNVGSCKAASSAGYEIEGVCRSARPGPNGTRLDSELHAVTRTDFESLATNSSDPETPR